MEKEGRDKAGEIGGYERLPALQAMVKKFEFYPEPVEMTLSREVT